MTSKGPLAGWHAMARIVVSVTSTASEVNCEDPDEPIGGSQVKAEAVALRMAEASRLERLDADETQRRALACCRLGLRRPRSTSPRQHLPLHPRRHRGPRHRRAPALLPGEPGHLARPGLLRPLRHPPGR